MTLAYLRDAPWLSGVRCSAYARTFFAVTVLSVVVWVALSSHGIDRFGRPLGIDFSSFYAASWLALHGEPALIYNPMIHAATERAIFLGRGFGYTAFFYPPTYMLACLPLAGLCFGCLTIAPQLAILVPILLVLRRDWRALGVAAATASGLAAASFALFGEATWQAFLHATLLAWPAMQAGIVPPGTMQSMFGAVQMLGGSAAAAFAAQAVMALGVCAALVRVPRRQPDAMAMATLAACGTLLATPFVLDTDLALLALPLAWLFSQARRDGFLPWEKLGMAAGFVLPMVSRKLALYAHVPLAPLVLLAVFALLLRRMAQTGPALLARPVPDGASCRFGC